MNNFYELFEHQVRKNPHGTAIVSGKDTVTYDVLDQRISDYGACLIKHNKSINTAIGLLVEPSIEAVVAMLACIKLKIPYIPLDKKYPENYVKKILQNAGVQCLCMPKNGIIQVQNKDAEYKVTQQGVAYIIYTSGTCGKPKGVMITYAGLKNLIEATKPLYNIQHGDYIPLFHSFAFDFSVWEIYSALLNGACLVVVPNEIKLAPSAYATFLMQNRISILNITPSFFYQLIPYLNESYYELDRLHLIIFGGEALQTNRLKPWFSGPLTNTCVLYNMFGITEGTVHSTYCKISTEQMNNPDSIIGAPLSGIEIAIVDEYNELVPEDMPGELCLGGVSVTPGYLNVNDTEAFISKKFTAKQATRWFKTKDIVKQKNGQLIYLDRKEGFIKVRGFRVDLKQIENILLSHDLIRNVFVTTLQLHNEHESIIAFVESEADFDDVEFMELLKKNLPQFMVPHAIIVLPLFPLTINNKLNVNVLKAKAIETIGKDNIMAESIKKSVDDLVKSIWCKLLTVDDVGLDINFFEAGGDSILLLRLQTMLQSKLAIDIPLLDLIRRPTLKQQIAFLRDNRQKKE